MLRRTLFALAVLAGPLAAQDQVPWRSSYFPYPIGNPTTGLMGVAHYHLFQQADYDARVLSRGIFSVDAGWSTNNSRFAALKFRAPLLVKNWRFAVDATAGRESRFGYSGQGPDGEDPVFNRDHGYDEDQFRVARSRYQLRAEVTRMGKGPLGVSLGAAFTHFRFTPDDGQPSVFGGDFWDEAVSGNDFTGRLTVFYDSRDKEFETTRGVLLESGVYAGTGKFERRGSAGGGVGPPVVTFEGPGYAGWYAHLRGYIPIRSTTVVAARVAVRALGKAAPLDARYTLPGWEKDFTVLGGAESHRSFIAGRYLGTGMALASVDVRQTVLDFGDYAAVTVIGFADAGRVWGEDNFDLKLKGWKVGGGGGIGLRILRAAVLMMNFAGGPDGFTFTMSNGFAF